MHLSFDVSSCDLLSENACHYSFGQVVEVMCSAPESDCVRVAFMRIGVF